MMRQISFALGLCLTLSLTVLMTFTFALDAMAGEGGVMIVEGRIDPGDGSGYVIQLNKEKDRGVLRVCDKDSVSLYVSDSQGNPQRDTKVEWKLLIKGRNGVPVVTIGLDSSASTGVCSFVMSPELLGIKRGWPYPFATYTEEQTNITYHEGVVRATIAKDDITYDIDTPLRLEVLPTKPILNVISYETVHDEYWGDWYPVVDLDVEVYNFCDALMGTTRGTWREAYGEGFDAGVVIPHRVRVDWGSEGCGFFCIAGNNYGMAYSDTIWSSTLTGIAATTLSDMRIETREGKCFVTFGQPVEHISVSDLKGHIWAEAKGKDRMVLRLPSGCYLFTVRDRKTCLTKKVSIN